MSPMLQANPSLKCKSGNEHPNITHDGIATHPTCLASIYVIFLLCGAAIAVGNTPALPCYCRWQYARLGTAMCSGWRPCAHTPTLLRYCQQAIRATFVALSRPLGSIRALVAPISHSLNTALIELRQRCRKATIELLDACVDVHLATFL